MKLIVGLGNPGRRYDGTRHNIGFEALAELGRRHQATGGRLAFQGETREATIAGTRCLLLTPHTYMNRSGQSVGDARDFYKIENESILVACDDFNLPLGKLRMRTKGSAGGQKGLDDVIRRLGDDFSRLRLGVGSPPAGWDAADFVLSKFTKEEQGEVGILVQRAADAIEKWLSDGPAAAMNQFNSLP
ncbi:MAG: aminoacyl-tRNA hydrolase [Pirellulales bacterium]|nr:aminoacyl-tRNA hydrolase [Pirellulales bacterium]